MAAIELGDECGQAHHDVDTIIVEIDAHDMLPKPGTLLLGTGVAKQLGGSSADRKASLESIGVLHADHRVDRHIVTKEAPQAVDHDLFEIMRRNPPCRFLATLPLLVMGNARRGALQGYGAASKPLERTVQDPSLGNPGAWRRGAPSQPAAIIAVA